jgi:excisionase family DNA binding protein
MTEPLTYTIEEAARLCGVSRGVAYTAAKSGDLPSVRLGRRIVVPRARLHALLDDQLSNGNGSASPEPVAHATRAEREHGHEEA